MLIGWSAACAVAYLQGFGRRPAWVLAEIVVVVALMLSTEFVASDQWALDNQSWPTTLWATNATISAAILTGPIAGMLTGVVVMIASTVVKGFINYDLGRNATIVIELAVGLAVRHGRADGAARPRRTGTGGHGLRRRWRNATGCRGRCTTARSRFSRWCPGVGAKSAERQRNWPSWPASRSGRCGGWSAPPTPSRGRVRWPTSGRCCGGERRIGYRSACPRSRCCSSSAVADELCAAAANALDNAASHAGPDARAYVLLEDLGDSVTVSIRDDGVGIADGRLEEAVAEGRVGVAKSIVGRMNWLGGSAKLNTGPGCGTEWELTVPRR